MFFCKKCRNFSSIDSCQFCGAKKLRKAQENDPVFLTTKKTFAYAGILQGALEHNKIPFIKQEKHGGMLKYLGLGVGLEEFSFYVPYGAYEKAKELLSELFKPCNLRLAKYPKIFKQGITYNKVKTTPALRKKS